MELRGAVGRWDVRESDEQDGQQVGEWCQRLPGEGRGREEEDQTVRE